MESKYLHERKQKKWQGVDNAIQPLSWPTIEIENGNGKDINSNRVENQTCNNALLLLHICLATLLEVINILNPWNIETTNSGHENEIK